MIDRNTDKERARQKEYQDSETTLRGHTHYPLFINVPWPWPFAAFSPQRSRFRLRPFHVGFVVDKVAL